jgi:hypothetical protein
MILFNFNGLLCFYPCLEFQLWFYPSFVNFVILPLLFENEAEVYLLCYEMLIVLNMM